MEVLEPILNAISQVGFPIVACATMFWYMNKERESHAAEVKELSVAVSSLQTTIQSNTTVLEKVLLKLD